MRWAYTVPGLASRPEGLEPTLEHLLADGGRITTAHVQAEVDRLRWLWRREAPGDGADAAPAAAAEEPSAGAAALQALLPAERLATMDLFDRLQLEAVLRVCRQSHSLSHAGRPAGGGCSRKPNPGLSSEEVLFVLMARTDDEDEFRRANVEPQDVAGGAKRDDQLAKRRAWTHLAVAVGRDRKMTVGSGAKGLDRLVGTHGVFHRLGRVQQEAEQAIQIGFSLGRELNPERHLRSCFTRAATFASSFVRTTSDGVEIPVRSYAANEASQRAAKSVCTRRYSTARRTDASTKSVSVSPGKSTESRSARSSGSTRTWGMTAVFMSAM